MSKVHVIRVEDINWLTRPNVDRILYIGRGGPDDLGNPFVIGKDGDRNQVIAKHDVWWRNQPHIIAALEELAVEQRDVYLVCHCAPERCHGDNYKREIERIKQHRKFK